MKNRRIALITIVVFLLSLIVIPAVVFAEDNLKLVVTTSKDDLFTGDDLTITISVENAYGSAAGQFNFLYDPEVLKLKGEDAVKKGDFFEGQEHTFLKNDRVEGDVGIIWILSELIDDDFGSINDSGVIATILFEVVGEGDTGFAFDNLILSGSDGETEDIVVDSDIEDIVTMDFDTAKQKAIEDANEAIDVIADLDRPITFEDKEAIDLARDLVDRAVNVFDADEDNDFPNLKKLEDADKLYDKLYAIHLAQNAIARLPALNELTVDDEDDVKNARVLVNIAKDNHDATDAEIGENYLTILKAAETQMAHLLTGQRPTPPTGGYNHYLSAVLVALSISILLGLKKWATRMQ